MLDNIHNDIRIIDLTAGDLRSIIKETSLQVFLKLLNDNHNSDLQKKAFTVAELARMGICGKEYKIHSLIKKKTLERTTDGKVTGLSIYKYINSI